MEAKWLRRNDGGAKNNMSENAFARAHTWTSRENFAKYEAWPMEGCEKTNVKEGKRVQIRQMGDGEEKNAG